VKFTNFAKQFDPDSGILQLMSDLGGVDPHKGPISMLGGGNPAMIPGMEQSLIHTSEPTRPY